MSDNKVLDPNSLTDFTVEDEEKIEKFVSDGLPAISSVDENQRLMMFDLYKSGKNYNSISGIMHTKKEIVLFLSKKFDWFLARREWHKQEFAKLPEILKNAENVGLLAAAESLQMIAKRLNTKNEDFFRTGVSTPANTPSSKEYQTLFKAIESLKKIQAPPQPSKGPIVNVNIGAKSDVSHPSDDVIDITPEDGLTEDERDDLLMERLANSNPQRGKK